MKNLVLFVIIFLVCGVIIHIGVEFTFPDAVIMRYEENFIKGKTFVTFILSFIFFLLLFDEFNDNDNTK